MTTLHITVGDRDDLREEALQFVRRAEDPETDAEGEGTDDEAAATASGPETDRTVLQFGTYEDLVDTLTPLRLELLEAIAGAEPDSMREAARLVDRDISDVHADLKRLEVVGIVDFEAASGGAMRPIVPFDRIEVHVDYPLLDEVDAGESPTSA